MTKHQSSQISQHHYSSESFKNQQEGGENIAKKSTISKNRYNKKTYKNFNLRIRKTETELIDFINQKENKNKYFIDLIKKDMQQ